MSNDLNRALITGTVADDPTVFTGEDGTRIVRFVLVSSQNWRNRKTGKMQEKVQHHRVVVLNTFLAELAEKRVRKGSMLFVEGSIETRRYTDGQGIERYITEVVLGDVKATLRFEGVREPAPAPADAGGGPW